MRHYASNHTGIIPGRIMDNQREKERDRSRRGDRPSRFSDAVRDRSIDRERSEGRRLFVSNIPYEYRWTDLKDLFKEKVRIKLMIYPGFYVTKRVKWTIIFLHKFSYHSPTKSINSSILSFFLLSVYKVFWCNLLHL